MLIRQSKAKQIQYGTGPGLHCDRDLALALNEIESRRVLKGDILLTEIEASDVDATAHTNTIHLIRC